MKPKILKNVYATIAALFIALFAMPTMVQAEAYDLKICGTAVTSDNCNDLSVIDGVRGTVKYDPANKVLTLQNATISSSDYNAIVSFIDDLTIKVIDRNHLETTDKTTVIAYKPLSIIGDGLLKVRSVDDSAIILESTNLTIQDCAVNAEGGKWGIAGKYGNNEKLSVINAMVKAIGKESGSICHIAELYLEDCNIFEPSIAWFNESEHAVVMNGEIVKSEVMILNYMVYNLKIYGEYVTYVNFNDLSVIDGVSGTVKYDPIARVLTLHDATISCYSGDAIHSNIDGLTIKVIGTNNITTENSSTVKAYKPTSIIGTGVLNVKSNAECAIYVEGTDLTIENCTVNAEGIDCGIAGLDGENEKLTIRNAKVTALGTEKGSIRDFSELNMIGCCITEPSGAWFGKSKHAVVLNGEIVKSKVVIEEIPAGIETPVTDNTCVQGIYTLSGIRLSGEPEYLPKGVYIVNGKKVVKP